MRHCSSCHGKEGAGDGREADFLTRQPRDFTGGVFKIKSSRPSTDLVRDEDLFHAISEGMAGAEMEGWKNKLSEKELWDLVAYIKTFSEIFVNKTNPPPLDYSSKVPFSLESVEKGKKVYDELLCHECHGPHGSGPSRKILKDDYGSIIIPRDLGKPWTFNGPYTAEGLYAGITNGIPLTPMQPYWKKNDSIIPEEKRWHVVNYLMMLGKKGEKKRKMWYISYGLALTAAMGLTLWYFRAH